MSDSLVHSPPSPSQLIAFSGRGRDGAQGPVGPTGPTGPQGPPGAPGGSGLVMVIGVPATTWALNHNLNQYPSVTVIDSTGETVWADYRYIDGNNIEVYFSAAFSGRAILR